MGVGAGGPLGRLVGGQDLGLTGGGPGRGAHDGDRLAAPTAVGVTGGAHGMSLLSVAGMAGGTGVTKPQG